MKSEIITNHIYPPIPKRDYDWEAVRKNYDEGDLIGYGKTEQEAINNLLEQESEIRELAEQINPKEIWEAKNPRQYKEKCTHPQSLMRMGNNGHWYCGLCKGKII